MISGTTKLIAHIGFPTETFKAPLIYNPYFEKIGVDAVVVPMGCKPEDFPEFLKLTFRLSNIHGALITMPHKVTVMGLLDELSTSARIAGSCNAVRLSEDGRLIGDMFDGEGFVRGVIRKGRQVKGARVLVVGSGGVGSAIAAAFAKAEAQELSIFDASSGSMYGLMDRLRQHYPATTISAGSPDPSGFDIVVNATPLGMKPGDPLPIDVSKLSGETFAGEVVMKQDVTPFLEAARARGCQFQIGTDMLFEQIPAYLEFFGFPTTSVEEIRAVARLK